MQADTHFVHCPEASVSQQCAGRVVQGPVPPPGSGSGSSPQFSHGAHSIFFAVPSLVFTCAGSFLLLSVELPRPQPIGTASMGATVKTVRRHFVVFICVLSFLVLGMAPRQIRARRS
jgi:hypothetical protein